MSMEQALAANEGGLMRTCSVDGCRKWSAPREGGLCYAHARRRRRRKALESPVREYGMQPLELVTRASLRHADAEDQDEYRRARDLLRKHADAYGKRTAAENVRKQNKPL